MTVLSALKDCYDRLADDKDSGIAPFGFSAEKISFELLLDANGHLLRVIDRRDTSGKRSVPQVTEVPQAVKRTVAVTANFLWDKASYVLGVGASGNERAAREHEAFKDHHKKLLLGTDDEGLQALLAFLDRWSPEQIETLDYRDELLQNPNLVFRLDGERRFLHQRPAARTIWAQALSQSSGGEGLCLVSGKTAPLARLHPPIKGVRGAQSSGASIVSFNLDAFTSYGKEQGRNAPVSEEAAFGYTTALNHLLRPGSPNRVQIADASTVFWAEGRAPAEEAFFSALVDPPDEEDARFDRGEAKRVHGVLLRMKDGRPLKDAAAELDLRDDTRFFVLGLAPNAARIAIRFWHQDSLGNLAARFAEHFRDFWIKPVPWRTAPAIWRLLYETAVQRKAENIPPNLGGEVMRAILTGNRYPRSLLAATVMRMRSDGTVNGMRAAICKACLVRDLRKEQGVEPEDLLVSLDRDEPNPAYRLGRLFAVLESVQSAALGNVNATIRDRYYGAASASPAAVFPLLIRGSRSHLANLRKGRAAGWVKKPQLAAVWYEREIGQIIDGLEAELPRSFSIGDQGRFAVGYYHQRFSPKKDAPDDVEAADTAEPAEHDED